MKSFTVAAIAALVASTSASVLPVKRDGECSLYLMYRRTQNPIVGGENTYVCQAKLTYADGREQELSTQCNEVVRDHCYASDLPYSVCVHTHNDLTEGYVDYSSSHIDFNGEGSCAGTKDVSPAGDSRSQTCAFAC